MFRGTKPVNRRKRAAMPKDSAVAALRSVKVENSCTWSGRSSSSKTLAVLWTEGEGEALNMHECNHPSLLVHTHATHTLTQFLPP